MKNLQALRADLTENKINLLTDQAAFMVKGGGGYGKKSQKKSGKKSRKSRKSNKGGGYGHGCGCYCGW